MLVNMKYLLDNANRDGYAVMAVNSVNMEMARAVIEAASEDAMLVHEAAIGKIAGDQIVKLETLGLTEEEAEQEILNDFLN